MLLTAVYFFVFCCRQSEERRQVLRKCVDTANAAWGARKQKEGHNNDLKSPTVMRQTSFRPSHDSLTKLALQINLASALCKTATEVEETDDAQTMAKVLIDTLRNSSARAYDSNLMRSTAYSQALPADLESLKPYELKEALEARDLDVTGERSQLLNRLQEYEARDNADDDSGSGSSSGDVNSDEEQYGDLGDDITDEGTDGADRSGAGSDDAAHEKEQSGEM
eukprot:COSAG02_NODE_16477_length_1080_cov_1.059123_1_plen_222_part_10